MIRKNELSMYKTNMLYLLVALLLVFVGTLVQGRNLFTGILITQFLLLVFPNVLFIKRSGLSIKKAWRLNRLSLKNIVLVVLITIFAYPIASYFQAVFVSLLSMIKEVKPNTLPIEISQIPFVWSVFFIAIVPGICEEIMFRGTILRAYEKLGIKKAVIISGILFGVFHFTLLNLVGPAILGIVFAIMVFKTNSIYSSMIAHGLNNLIALTLNYFLMKNIDLLNEVAVQDTPVDMGGMMVSFLMLGVFVVFMIIIVKKLLGKLTPDSLDLIEIIDDEDQADENVYLQDQEVISFYNYIPLVFVAIMFFVFNFRFIFV